MVLQLGIKTITGDTMTSWAIQNLLMKREKPSLIISYIGTTNRFGTSKKRIKKKKYVRFALYCIFIFLFLSLAPRI